MRTFASVVCSIVLFSIGCSGFVGGGFGGNSNHPIVGSWKGEDFLGQTMEIEFAADGDFSLNVSGRQTFQKHGSYTIDDSKMPNHLNIKLSDRDEIKTIFEIRGNDILIFENTNSSGDRPSKFGDYKMELMRQ